jgi:hypothetical protein
VFSAGILNKKAIEVTFAEPIKITRKLVVIFEKLKIPYYIVGSLASSLYGIPRATADADMIADIRKNHVHPLIQDLQKDFYIDEDRVKEAIQKRSSFNIIHLQTMFKIDVFLTKDDDCSHEEMARREKFQVTEERGQDLYLASPEDVILNKLHWYESGGRVTERQWNDVIGIVRVLDKRLDVKYLKNKATKRGVINLLEKALKEK